jgi:hypothetical protein
MGCAALGLFAIARLRTRPAQPPSVEGQVAPALPLEDPRLTLTTPFQNVRPEVNYVGDAVCSRCHGQIAATYHKHPMGRSFGPVTNLIPLPCQAQPEKILFQAAGFEYTVERRGSVVYHRETFRDPKGKVVAHKEAPVRFVLGSGTRGYTFLIDEDGYLFQSPISWYARNKIWDLAPGYRQHNTHFDRPINGVCLFCHTNAAEPVAGPQNRYRQPLLAGGYAIGCERCHGPGELHVHSREHHEEVAAEFDTTIVNPRHLEPALREAVCEQCHLQGQAAILRRGRNFFDFRPGLPLSAFWSIFVWSAGQRGNLNATGQVEQMVASRCFRASAGKLGCISCHDPHEEPGPEKKVAHYRDRCLSCHVQPSACSLPLPERRRRTPEDNCLACHMPRLNTEIAHTSATDHRIQRRPMPASSERNVLLMPPAGAALFIPFFGDAGLLQDEELSRDLGVALVQFIARESPSESLRRRLAQDAWPRLERAVQRAADDIEAREAWGHVLLLQGDRAGALEAYRAVLTLCPDRESSLSQAAAVAEQLGQDSLALEYGQRLVAVNPWQSHFHAQLAQLLAKRRDWDAALRHCREAEQLNPFGLETRKIAINCLLAQGDKEKARVALEILLALDPEHAEEMRRWFATQR